MTSNVSKYVARRAADHGTTLAIVRSGARHRNIVDVRFAIATELRTDPWRLSLTDIGAALGGRDHSTIIALLRRPIRAPASHFSPAGVSEMSF